MLINETVLPNTNRVTLKCFAAHNWIIEPYWIIQFVHLCIWTYFTKCAFWNAAYHRLAIQKVSLLCQTSWKVQFVHLIMKPWIIFVLVCIIYPVGLKLHLFIINIFGHTFTVIKAWLGIWQNCLICRDAILL